LHIDQIEAMLIGVVADVKLPSDIVLSRDSVLRDDIEFDDLDLIEFVMRIEELFEIEISDDEEESWLTFGDVVSYITKRLEGDSCSTSSQSQSTKISSE